MFLDVPTHELRRRIDAQILVDDLVADAEAHRVRCDRPVTNRSDATIPGGKPTRTHPDTQPSRDAPATANPDPARARSAGSPRTTAPANPSPPRSAPPHGVAARFSAADDATPSFHDRDQLGRDAPAFGHIRSARPLQPRRTVGGVGHQPPLGRPHRHPRSSSGTGQRDSIEHVRTQDLHPPLSIGIHHPPQPLTTDHYAK